MNVEFLSWCKTSDLWCSVVEMFALLVCFMAWVGSWWLIFCSELSVTNSSHTTFQRSKDLDDTWKGLNISIVAVILCCIVVWWYVQIKVGRLIWRFFLFHPLSHVMSTNYNECFHRFVSSYYISSSVILLLLCTHITLVLPHLLFLFIFSLHFLISLIHCTSYIRTSHFSSGPMMSTFWPYRNNVKMLPVLSCMAVWADISLFLIVNWASPYLCLLLEWSNM